MILIDEVLEELIMTTNKRSTKATVTSTEFDELKNIAILLNNRRVTQHDYQTNYQLKKGYSPTLAVGGQKDDTEYRQNYEFAIEVLNIMLDKYRSTGNIPKEIKAVISYMIYRAMEIAEEKHSLDEADKLVNQREFLEKELGLQKKKIDTWGIRPKQYYHVTHYKQPKSPIHYMGAKTDDYGYALRQLVYQAGNYKTFADIFGGGGNASLAVILKDTSKYYYNELKPIVYNTIEVLQDDKLCKSLLNLFGEFRQEVQGISSSKFLANYVQRSDMQQAEQDAYNQTGDDVVFHVTDIEPLKIHTTNVDKVEFIKSYNDKYGEWKNENNHFTVGGTPYTTAQLICKDANGNPDIAKFNTPLVNEMARMLRVPGVGYYIDNTGQRRKIDDIKIGDEKNIFHGFAHMQVKLLIYWHLFNNMYKTREKAAINGLKFVRDDEKVFYAFACLFLECFKFHGNGKGNTSIFQLGFFSTGDGDEKNYKNLDTAELFLGLTEISDVRWTPKYPPRGVFLTDEIKEFHKRFKCMKLSNLDFRVFMNIIPCMHPKSNKKAKFDPILFYSDSPYLETKDYNDTGSQSEEFDENDMNDLINLLIDSGQKFIFSCRACKSVSSNATLKKQLKPEKRFELIASGDKEITALMDANKFLWDNIFFLFKQKAERAKMDLYVLAVEEGEKDLADHLRMSDVVELMICNFKIRDFSNNGSDAKQTTFSYYTYDEFLTAFVNNAIVDIK